ncbi:hypothetical protein [Microvirga thermotolerans]|uniref:Uncharacterized protein n=1 Tax=Microvirga thermotolerans TaxID=2651334 RepID=A0A5P9JZT2_9HYPH|nr:hypothetical protein [Microvirga thermotolerans]QFU17248.1 hypothetical protein GDR74_14025 [Microvirga thermotolerans]
MRRRRPAHRGVRPVATSFQRGIADAPAARAGACAGLALVLALSAILAAAAGGAAPARAQGAAAPSWVEVKCARYRQAWGEALARRGRQGLSRDFLDSHEAFLASGCTESPGVCPRSAEELDLANMMVVAAMNAGTASTFPPFRCPR